MEAFLVSPRRCAGVLLVACAMACGSSSKSDDGNTPEPSGGSTPAGSTAEGNEVQEAPPSPLPEPEGGPSPSTFVPRYFVSPRGSDSNVCSQKEPCREIVRALSLVTVAGSRWVTARKCVFRDNARSNINVLFTDDLRLELDEATGSIGSNGIAVMASSDRPAIRWNRVSGNRFAGIQIDADYERPDTDGTYAGVVDGLTTGAVVAGNIVSGNGAAGGAAINLDGVKDSLLVNNVLYDNLAAGLAAYGDADGVPGDGLDGGDDYDGEGRFGPSGLRIVHNTIVMPATSKRSALNLRYSQGTTKNVLVNNILVHENPGAAALELGFAADVALLDASSNAGSSLSGPANATATTGGVRTP